LALRALTASSVWPSVKTFARRRLASFLSTRPLGKTTFVMATGLVRQPPLFTVTNARVSSRGETPPFRPPSVSAGRPSSGEVIPMSFAVSATATGPRSSASCWKTVLSEDTVAWNSDLDRPDSPPSVFWTSIGPHLGSLNRSFLET
jgi:hypothetical protein